MISRIKKRHIALLSLLSIVAVSTILYIRHDQVVNGEYTKPRYLRSYDKERDFLPLAKLMHDNMFLLSENPKFSPEKFLTNKAPKEFPDKKGELNIDVVDYEGETAGFIAYYKKSRAHGFVWLLAVDKRFRGHYLGESLLASAINYFKTQKVSFITISTRLINRPAISLYKKMGFVEKSRDEDRGFITLINKLR